MAALPAAFVKSLGRRPGIPHGRGSPDDTAPPPFAPPSPRSSRACAGSTTPSSGCWPRPSGPNSRSYSRGHRRGDRQQRLFRWPVTAKIRKPLLSRRYRAAPKRPAVKALPVRPRRDRAAAKRARHPCLATGACRYRTRAKRARVERLPAWRRRQSAAAERPRGERLPRRTGGDGPAPKRPSVVGLPTGRRRQGARAEWPGVVLLLGEAGQRPQDQDRRDDDEGRFACHGATYHGVPGSSRGMFGRGLAKQPCPGDFGPHRCLRLAVCVPGRRDADYPQRSVPYVA